MNQLFLKKMKSNTFYKIKN